MSDDRYPKIDGRVYFDLARDRLSMQLETLDAIDNKIALLFTTSTTLVGILAAVLALRTARFDTVSYILVGVSIIAYAKSAWHGWHGYRARTWKSGPLLKQVWGAYTADPRDLTDEQIAWAVADRMRLDYEENGNEMKAKTDALDAIGPALFVQTITLVLTLVLVAA